MPAAPYVLSIGSINCDVQARAESWPQQSETRLARDFLCAGGGKGANVAYAVAKLGVPARLLGRVGNDAFAELALRGLRQVGVDLTQVRCVPDSQTGVAMIVVRDDGDKTIVLAPNANLRWEASAAGVLRTCIEALPSGSIVAVDLEVPVPVVLAGLCASRERGLCSVLDPSPADRATDELLRLSSYVVPNPREAQTLTGVEVRDPHTAKTSGLRLLARGASHACVKLPAGGVVWVGPERSEHLEVPAAPVVDTTGAGDAFAAGLCAALCRGLAPRAAAREASAAATFAVGRYGSQAAYPTRAELDGMLAEVPR